MSTFDADFRRLLSTPTTTPIFDADADFLTPILTPIFGADFRCRFSMPTFNVDHPKPRATRFEMKQAKTDLHPNPPKQKYILVFRNLIFSHVDPLEKLTFSKIDPTQSLKVRRVCARERAGRLPPPLAVLAPAPAPAAA